MVTGTSNNNNYNYNNYAAGLQYQQQLQQLQQLQLQQLQQRVPVGPAVAQVRLNYPTAYQQLAPNYYDAQVIPGGVYPASGLVPVPVPVVPAQRHLPIGRIGYGFQPNAAPFNNFLVQQHP